MTSYSETYAEKENETSCRADCPSITPVDINVVSFGVETHRDRLLPPVLFLLP